VPGASLFEAFDPLPVDTEGLRALVAVVGGVVIESALLGDLLKAFFGCRGSLLALCELVVPSKEETGGPRPGVLEALCLLCVFDKVGRQSRVLSLPAARRESASCVSLCTGGRVGFTLAALSMPGVWMVGLGGRSCSGNILWNLVSSTWVERYHRAV